MSIIVQKFGGTSVADIERIENVATIIKYELEKNNKVIVIVSAMAGVTNSLIAKCNQVSRLENAINLREYDAAIASGEILTSALLALRLQNLSIQAKSLHGWQVPIITNNIYGNAQIKEINPTNIQNLLDDNIVPIITGFQGLSSEDNSITTLGKGGSDTSAAVIAAAIKAERCDIYTDVDGIYSADPRIVHDAHKIDIMNIDQLCKLCSSGAKVLHPRAALAAKRYGFNLRVLSSFSQDYKEKGISAGTIIKQHNNSYLVKGKQNKINEGRMEESQITAITSNKNLVKVDIEHRKSLLSDIYMNFTQEAISIEEMQIIDESRLYIIANLSDRAKIESMLNRLKSNSIILNYQLNINISTVTIIGYGILDDNRLSWDVMNVLYQNNIEIIQTRSDNVSMSILTNDQDTEKIIKLLHAKFF